VIRHARIVATAAAMVAAVLVPTPAEAAPPPDSPGIDYRIHLKNRSIDAKASVDTKLLDEVRAGKQPRRAIVQLAKMPRAQADDLATLRSLGVNVLGHLGGVNGLSTAYLATISPDVRSGEKAFGDLVRSVVRLQPSDKLAATLPKGPAQAFVQFFADSPATEARRVFAEHGLTARGYAPSVWLTTATPAQLQKLAGVDAVQWIAPGPPPLSPTIDETRSIGNVNVVQGLDPATGQYAGLTGAGVQVGIMDTGVDSQHQDFENRIVRAQDDGGDHGSHVAGIAAGSGVRSNQNDDAGNPNGGSAFQWRGVAPQAGIAAYGQAGGDTATFTDAINTHGVDVTNHSYVLQFQGQYDAGVAAVDQIVRGDSPGIPARPVVWAAANNASYDHQCSPTDPSPRPQYPGGCPDGFQTGFFSVLSPCKNCIDVAAIDKARNWATFSSLGPTMDGRLGPIVSAVGVGVTSVGADTGDAIGNGYRGKSGTSMASPAVAGMVALMRQQYGRSGHGINGPLPSTDKAILAQTATDLQGTSGADNPDTDAPTPYGAGPDWATGFGQANAGAAVDLIRRNGFVENQLSAANPTDEFALNVVPGQAEAKVTLAWDDRQGTPGADDTAAKLVNDLDLFLVDPNGVVHRPLVLPVMRPRDCDGNTNNGVQVGTCAGDLDTEATTGNDYDAVAAEGTDRRNVIEQAVIQNPVPGRWTVRASVLNQDGTTVRLPMGGTQRYSLAGVTADRADLSIVKTDTPDPVNAGEELYYNITVTNHGPATARNVVVADELPGGRVSFVTSTGNCAETMPADLTCPIGDLLSGQSRSFTVKVAVAPWVVSQAGHPTSLLNTASVSSQTPDDDPADNSATAGTIVEDKADVGVTKMCKPDTEPGAGQEILCTIFVDNHGPSYARDVVVDDTMLSDGTFTVGTPVASQGNCSAAAPVTGGQRFTCDLGNLTNASTSTSGRATVTYTLTADDGQDINNVATVRSDTPDPAVANNKAIVNLNVRSVADVSLTKTGTPDPVTAGTNLTYTLTATNHGPSAAAGVLIEEDLPAGVQVVSVTGTGATCNAGVPGEPSQPTRCSFGNVASGSSRTMTVVVKVPSDTPAGTTLRNDARVSSTTFDNDLSDNLATTTTGVITRADLAVVKTSDKAVYKPLQTIAYTITVTNNGPSDAQGVTMVDTLPPHLHAPYISDDGDCSLSSDKKTLTCPIGTVPSGTSKVIHVYNKVLLTLGGHITNTATASSATTDPAAPNNTSTRTVQVKLL
jgi:uncharacterized repeat protein (TIGR01451 family)